MAGPFDPNALPTLSGYVPIPAAATLGVPAAVPQGRPTLGGILQAGLERAWGEARYGVPAAIGGLVGGLSPESAASHKQGLDYWNQKAEEAAPGGAATIGDVFSGKVNPIRYLAENVAALPGGVAGMIPGSVVASALAGPEAAPIGAIFSQSILAAGQNAARSLQETGTVTQGQAFRGALAAPIQGALAVEAGKFIPGLSSGVLNQAGEEGATALARMLSAGAKGAIANAAAGVSQAAGERLAAGVPMTNAEAMNEFVSNFANGAAIGGVFGAVHGVFGKVKPAEQFTNDDMAREVDAKVAPAQAGPAGMPAQPDRLPLQGGGMNVEQQLDLPLRGPEARGPNEVQPALPIEMPSTIRNPLSALQPDTQLDMFGNRVTDDVNVPAAPKGPTQEQIGAWRDMLSDAGNLSLIKGLNDMMDPEHPAAQQLPPVMNELIRQELDRRGVEIAKDENGNYFPKNLVFPDQQQPGAPQQPDVSQAFVPEGQRAGEDFQSQLATWTDGVKSNAKYIQALRNATTPEEAQQIVYDELNRKNGAMSADTVARRMGLLNPDDGKPTDMWRAIEDGRAQAEAQSAAAEKAAQPFPDWWKENVLQNPEFRKAADVKALKPESPEDLQDKVYQALANQDTATAKPVAADYTNMEKLARQVGLVDADGKFTDLGKQVALRAPLDPDEMAATATKAGFTDDTSQQVYMAGARGEPVNLTNFKDLAAYEAGKLYKARVADDIETAIGRTKSDAQTDAFLQSKASEAEAVTPPTVESRKGRLLPNEVDIQAQNQALDALNLPPERSADVAAIKDMIRNGRPIDEITQAVDTVQNGGTILTPDALTKEWSFQPATSLARAGQPRFVEMNTPEDGRLKSLAAKVAEKQDTEGAISAYQAYKAEADAYEGKAILADARDAYARGKGIIDKQTHADIKAAVAAGDFETARKLLPSAKPETQAAAPVDTTKVPTDQPAEQLPPVIPGEPKGRISAESVLDGKYAGFNENEFGDPPSQHAIDMDNRLTGKTCGEAISVLRQEAPNPFYKAVAAGTERLYKILEKAGVQFEFGIVRNGDTLYGNNDGPPLSMNSSRGVTQIRDGNVRVWLNGPDLTGKVGTSFPVAMHEMLHAVTHALISNGKYLANSETTVGRAVQDLIRVRNAVVKHFNDRVALAGAGKTELTDFENLVFNKGTNALKNADEILAQALTKHSVMEYLDSIPYTPKQTIFGKLVDVARKALGLPKSDNTALTEVLRTTNALMNAPKEEVAALGVHISKPQTLQEQAGSAVPGRPDETNKATQIVSRVLDNTLSKAIKPMVDGSFGTALQKFGYSVASLWHLAELHGGEMPGLKTLVQTHEERQANVARMAQLWSGVHQTMMSAPKEVQDATNRLMQATMYNINPAKDWESQTWLHDEPNSAELKRLWGDYSNTYKQLAKEGQLQHYQSYSALMEMLQYAGMALKLHNAVRTNPELSELRTGLAGTDPMRTFTQTGDVHNDPIQARNYWQGELKRLTELTSQYVQSLRGDAQDVQRTAAEKQQVDRRLKPLELTLKENAQNLQTISDRPYFHLGRNGDHYVRTVMATAPDGTVNRMAPAKIAEALRKAGFDDSQFLISADNKNPGLYMTFQTAEQRTLASRVFAGLAKDGWIKNGEDGRPMIEAGQRGTTADLGLTKGKSEAVKELLQHLGSETLFNTENMSAADKARVAQLQEAMIADLYGAHLEMLPDTALAKVMTTRANVGGASSDMLGSLAQRFTLGATALGNMAAAPDLTHSLQSIYDTRARSQNFNDPFHPKVDMLTNLANEVTLRESQRGLIERTQGLDKVRAATNLFYLGMSPAYMMVHVTQLGATLWPELAKRTSFVDAAGTIARATPIAFGIMSEVFNQARKVGWDRVADAIITEDALKNVKGLEGKVNAKRDFIMKMLASGTVDIGAAARELQRTADPTQQGKVNTLLKYGSAASMYSETFTRLIAALAAHDVAGKNNLDHVEYARKVMGDAMLTYSNWNIGRALGKKGWFGPFTPVMSQFMQYSAQVTEKLYRELHTAFMDHADGFVERELNGMDPSDPRYAEARAKAEAKFADERRASRRFLAGNAAAMVVMAGSMGLPFATPAAAAVKKLEDIFGEPGQPHDPLSDWHNFLNDTFGDGVGNALARGLPHALGADMSQRVGEQNLLPFSEFLLDQRSWRDMAPDMAINAFGAPMSMASSIMNAGEKIRAGNILGGMADMLPAVMRNPIKAYQMDKYGYVDSKGMPLPIKKPGTADIVLQSLGFQPADKALYGEMQQAKSMRQNYMQRQAGLITNNIMLALQRQDMDSARQWITKAQAFDKNNPAYMVLPGIAQAFAGRQRGLAVAQATETPTGVKPTDIQGRSELRFGRSLYQ